MSSSRRLLILLAAVVAAGCGKTEPASAPGPNAPAGAPKAAAAPAEPIQTIGSVKDRDVIVVVVDGLRADLAQASADALFINELAGQGLNFTDAISNSSHVMQSLSSFFTGRLPTRGGAIGVFEAEPQESSRTIAQAYQQAGYYTGLLANHPAIQGMGFTKGFQEVQVAQAGQPLDDDALITRAKEFLEDAGTDRVFLYVHLSGMLSSHLVQPDLSADAATAPYAVRDFGKDYRYTTEELTTSPRAKATHDEYRAAMKSADAKVKSLVDVVQASGRLDKAVLVVTSLHGFELLEHGYLGAGWTLYDESIRVPLIVRAPGAVPAVKSAAPVSLVDVAPSLLTISGLEFDRGTMDGRSLFAAKGDGFEYAYGDTPRIAELIIPERCVVRAVVTRTQKYIAAGAWAEPKDRFALAEAHRDTANAIASGAKQAPPLWGAGAQEAVFGEPGDVAHDDAGARESLAKVLAEYRRRCETSGLPPRSPTVTVKAVDPSQIENLESLGYL